MSVNTSIPFNASSCACIYTVLYSCLDSAVGSWSINALTITRILVTIPLCIPVLFLGFQQWQRQRSGTRMSHFDVFTYNMIVIELLGVSGCLLTCFGVYTGVFQVLLSGVYILLMTLSGQTLFHILTCVERYLAVVHPVTYLSLKKAKGVRIRNVTICCVWLLCFLWASVTCVMANSSVIILNCCILAFSLTVISFCSLSVLCVLIRSGPGEGGGSRERADRSKLRAFSTIMAILGVLVFRFGANMAGTTLYGSAYITKAESCGLWFSVHWFSLPCSLVSPLLFLHKEGKLSCFKNNDESGQGSN